MPTRWRLVLVVLVGLLATLAAPPGVDAVADTESRRDDVRAERAAVAARVDALRASDAEVSQALQDLDANVRATEAQLADAQREADVAAARAAEAERGVREAESRLAEVRRRLVDAAVEAYVEPRAERSLDALTESSADVASTKAALLEVTQGSRLDVVEQLRAARGALATQRAEAARAHDEAEARRTGLAARAAGYERARVDQQRVAAGVRTRIDEALAESAALSALDAQLSQQLADEQAALAAALRASTPSPSAGGGSGSGGGGGAAPGGPVVVTPGPGNLATVRGITVAASIAGQLASLLEAAEAAGHVLGGSGYRDSSSQIALRRAHCGTSDYAIWQMPPDQCTPPTAIPGRSKHEQGLAVDFTVGGHTLRRGDAAFGWLQAHAVAYGFANLPSEPWHWSVDGS